MCFSRIRSLGPRPELASVISRKVHGSVHPPLCCVLNLNARACCHGPRAAQSWSFSLSKQNRPPPGWTRQGPPFGRWNSKPTSVPRVGLQPFRLPKRGSAKELEVLLLFNSGKGNFLRGWKNIYMPTGTKGYKPHRVSLWGSRLCTHHAKLRSLV